MYINLSGLNVLLTGGGGDVGKAIASRLAESGATVALHYHKKEKEVESITRLLGNNSRAFSANFVKNEEVGRLVKQVLDEFEEIDVLVNSVGVLLPHSFLEKDEKWLNDWQLILQANLTSSVFLCKKLVEHWLEKKVPGRIINVGSGSALQGEKIDKLSYAVSKAGMIALTRSIARSYAPDGIRSWVLLPGKIKSRLGGSFSQEGDDKGSKKNFRGMEPRDLAPMVAFLCSGLADYASGSTIDVNTGEFFHPA
ncbi:MAG: SDR family NAD(P)-dependent oxidoreductase [Cytophagales bacterium]|nr:SDR family NAD(P)-dependent oxidoreductase [Cytophagales bacterium]